MTEHHLRRDLREGHADGLRDIRNRSTRARIRLEHVHGVVLDGQLKVHQADDLQGVADLPRDAADLVEHGLRERLGGQHTGGVPEWMPASSMCSWMPPMKKSLP